MRKLAVLLLVSLMASMSFAGIDPDPDSFGVYFDTAGNTIESTVAVFTPFYAYLLLMNPVGVTDGYECTVNMTGPPFFALSTDLPANSLDVDASAAGFAVGAAAPLPTVNGAMLLCTWQLMVQSSAELSFFISQATLPSLPGGLPVVTGEGVLRRCGIASGDPTLPVARVNPFWEVFGTEVSSFGSVKSLFR